MLVFTLAFAALLGLLIGSFANVVIYRLPLGRSIVYPGSSCPKCGHKLSAFENIPVLSWLFLRGRCRSCSAPISARYPLVETLMALGFVAIVWRWPPLHYGWTALPLLILYAMLVILSLIDIDHFVLPDRLTLSALLVALAGTALYNHSSKLPSFSEALYAAMLGAGLLALVNRIGSLVMRRFTDTAERLWPIGMDQLNLAALGGAVGGFWLGTGLAAASLLLNLLSRRALRLSEPLVYGLWFLALVANAGLGLFLGPLEALSGSLTATGAVAVIGAVYWWVFELVTGKEPEELPADDADEPIAMGFGDVKLAAVLGAMLGWQGLGVGLFLSFILGAVVGVIVRAFGGGRQIPFGPYLAVGGLVALFFSEPLISWYLGLLGF